MFDPEAKTRRDEPGAEAAAPDVKSPDTPEKPAKAARAKKKTDEEA
jgi:hypothetical protein